MRCSNNTSPIEVEHRLINGQFTYIYVAFECSVSNITCNTSDVWENLLTIRIVIPNNSTIAGILNHDRKVLAICASITNNTTNAWIELLALTICTCNGCNIDINSALRKGNLTSVNATNNTTDVNPLVNQSCVISKCESAILILDRTFCRTVKDCTNLLTGNRKRTSDKTNLTLLCLYQYTLNIYIRDCTCHILTKERCCQTFDSITTTLEQRREIIEWNPLPLYIRHIDIRNEKSTIIFIIESTSRNLVSESLHINICSD